jgi:hypothetical protein
MELKVLGLHGLYDGGRRRRVSKCWLLRFLCFKDLDSRFKVQVFHHKLFLLVGTDVTDHGAIASLIFILSEASPSRNIFYL